jgi:hypothetical protein
VASITNGLEILKAFVPDPLIGEMMAGLHPPAPAALTAPSRPLAHGLTFEGPFSRGEVGVVFSPGHSPTVKPTDTGGLRGPVTGSTFEQST